MLLCKLQDDPVVVYQLIYRVTNQSIQTEFHFDEWFELTCSYAGTESGIKCLGYFQIQLQGFND